jgi:drug/metabolite transporter (DMT)-like permease
MKTYAKLWLTSMFWGGAFIAGRHVAQRMDPFTIAFVRFAVAGVVLLAMTWRKEGRLPRLDRSHLLAVVLLGATGIYAYNAMFFRGLRLIEASRAALIIATTPAFIALGSGVFFRERLGVVRISGILLAVFGALVVISKGDLAVAGLGGLGHGELLIVACVLSWVAYSLIGKVVMRTVSPLVAVSYSVVVGTCALFVSACFEGLGRNLRSASLLDWLAIIYMAVFATVIGFVWFYEGVKHIGTTRAGLFINFVPVFAVSLAYVILGEDVTASLGVGGLFVLMGVYLTNRVPPRRHPPDALAEDDTCLAVEAE